MPDSDPPLDLAPIFIAATVAEARFIEDLLEAEGIEYELRPEPFLRTPLSGACLTGVLFEVLGGQAEYCRALIRQAGLARGLVFPDETTG